MAHYESLKATIDAYIRQNGVKAITGPVLNGVLNAMVDSLGDGFLFEGEALPNSPGETPDQNVVRYATRPGTYTNYGGYVHDGKHLVWMVWMGSWNAYPTQVPTDASLPTLISQLTNDAGYITAASLNAYYTKVQTDALLSGKQATLVSGSNIKTINNESLLGSGNIDIQGGGTQVQADWDEADPTDPSYIRNKPTIPSAPGTLDTDNTTAQTVSSNESLAGTVKLHKVSKTGSYNDLNNLPTIPAPQVQSDWNEADNTDPSYIKNKPTIPGPEIFWATYGMTTNAEIDAAVSGGKAVMCYYNNRLYVYANKIGGTHYLNAWHGVDNEYSINVSSSDVWSDGGIRTFQVEGNITDDILSNRTNVKKYPNTKGVFNFTSKYGVISQTQTWSGTFFSGYTYALSDIVLGAIPLDFINNVRVIDGAVFNDVTGYFELNDLTDISYEEMMVIHDVNNVVKSTSCIQSQTFRNLKKRPRTLTIVNNVNQSISFNSYFRRLGTSEICELETVCIGDEATDKLQSTGFDQSFYRCQYLRKIGIKGNLAPSSTAVFTICFSTCASLTDLRIVGLNKDLPLADAYFSSQISMDSLAYIINNASTGALTITVSAAKYTEALADAAVTAALAAHTNVTLASA